MIQRRTEALWQSRDFRALVFLAGLAIVGLVFAFAIRGLLGPFIIAALFALVLNPAVNRAQRRRIPRALAVLLLYAAIVGAAAAVILYVAPLIQAEFSALVAQGPAIAGYFQELALKRHVVSVLGLPIDLRQAYESTVSNLPTLLAGQLDSVLANVFMLVNWALQALLILLITFFLVKDAKTIRNFFESLVPRGRRDDARELAREISRMLGAYMRGQLVICSLVGAVTAIAMWLIGVPDAAALGIIAGVTAFIPFIGPLLGVLPAVAVAAFTSQSLGKVGLVLAIYFIISTIIYNVISPKVFGDAVHLSPMLVIFAFVAGGYLAGILGLFLAVPVAAAVRILFLYLQERVYA